ncbi:MAG: Gfo/Idh/MocA family oxidoreductase [Gemmatimonadota bacterium]|nr:Gfo/Idh/MocA family oxidoreductase [Gemmatimonadota bacterium]
MSYRADAMSFGLIGCGDIGQLRARAVAKASHRLTAVSDVDGRKMAQAARHGAAQFADWREMVERLDVDAVIVSTPPILHAELTVGALHAGKHVLCEKPLARDPAECHKMLDAATETGRVLATGFNYRFYPSFRLAREWLHAGRIGDLSHIRSYGGYSVHDQPKVYEAEVVGGGALHDIGIHLMDLTRWFLGEVESVQGLATGSVWNLPGCEDNAFVLLRGAAGRVATLHASWTEWGRYQFMIELVGRSGRIRASCFPMFVELLSSDRPGGQVTRTVERFPLVFLGEHLRSYRWVVVKSFVQELDAFARLVRGEASDIATGPDGARAVEIAYSVSHAEAAARDAER